jgi:hypothetical protein
MELDALDYLLLGQTSPVPVRRLVVSQSRFDGFGDEVNLLPLPGIESQFLGRPALSLVTTPATINVLPKLVS